MKYGMLNDGNGTCYDKTTYQSFIARHQDKYVMQVREGGSDMEAKPISDCTIELQEKPLSIQELKRKGGYALKDGASKFASSKIVISAVFFIAMLSHPLLY